MEKKHGGVGSLYIQALGVCGKRFRPKVSSWQERKQKATGRESFRMCARAVVMATTAYIGRNTQTMLKSTAMHSISYPGVTLWMLDRLSVLYADIFFPCCRLFIIHTTNSTDFNRL